MLVKIGFSMNVISFSLARFSFLFLEVWIPFFSVHFNDQYLFCIINVTCILKFYISVVALNVQGSWVLARLLAGV